MVEGLTLDEFFNGRSIPRNRELMRIFKDLELVEQLGSGMNRILSIYDKDIFYVSDNFIQITFTYELAEQATEQATEQAADQVTDQVTEQATEQATEQVTEQATEQAADQVTDQVTQLILSLEKDVLSISEIMDKMELKHRPTFLYNSIHPAIELGLIEKTIPESPSSPKQKYRLTKKGRDFLNRMN